LEERFIKAIKQAEKREEKMLAWQTNLREYCVNNRTPFGSNKCNCRSLICMDREKHCVFGSELFKMTLSCELKKPVQLIDASALTKEDCECKFSHTL